MPARDFDSPGDPTAPRNNRDSWARSTSAADSRTAWAFLKERGTAGWKYSFLNLKVLGGLFKETFSHWTEDKAPRLGAALAYYTIFSLAPLLIIAIALAGLVFGEQAAQGTIVRQIGGLVGERGAETIQSVLQSAHKPAIGTIVGIIGVVTLMFGASGVFGELQDALNTVWHVPNRQKTIWENVKGRFPTYLMVLGIGFLLLVIFKILPQTHVAWSDVWVGAAVTALLFDIGKLLIGLYLGKSSIASTYGAASSLAIVLAWVYYSAQILYFGAEFTRVYARRHGSRSEGRSAPS